MSGSKLDDVAAAIGTYAYVKMPLSGRYAVLHRDRADVGLPDFAEETDAAAECALLNARAGIEVLREPTKEMLNAARDWSIRKNGLGVGDEQAAGCLQAMIDSLLKSE